MPRDTAIAVSVLKLNHFFFLITFVSLQNNDSRKKIYKKKRPKSQPEFKPAKCSCLKKCLSKFRRDEQKAAFEKFYSLDWSEQTEYIFNLIELVPIRKRRRKLKNVEFKKSTSRKYYLIKRDGTKLNVCKNFFQDVISLLLRKSN